MRAFEIGKYLLLILIPVGISAQDTVPDSEQRPQAVVDCSQDRFETAEHIFQDKLKDASFRERQLKEILEQCFDAPWNSNVSEFLRSAREDRAEYSLYIANYYKGLYNSGNSMSLKAPESRYKEIIEKYPEYSKKDLVLLLLGDVQTAEGMFDEAWMSYQKLINEFPSSPYVKDAYKHLEVLQKRGAELINSQPTSNEDPPSLSTMF